MIKHFEGRHNRQCLCSRAPEPAARSRNQPQDSCPDIPGRLKLPGQPRDESFDRDPAAGDPLGEHDFPGLAVHRAGVVSSPADVDADPDGVAGTATNGDHAPRPGFP
ncbi:hypothetical protein [Amycolatopsis balhimycina]|uniref:hypothetical protein n=1 Tax=Amycolatopsis balhimycina TaxID=208443 RepID=UPI000F79032D|nr:hypothetical protein [Amycolatopsis balhimycina]